MPAKLYSFKLSTTLTALFIVLSATFTRQLMEFTTHHIGKDGFRILIAGIFIILSAVFLAAEAKRLANPFRFFVMLALLGTTLFYSWKIKMPQVRMHILMYSIVGWLATRDATKSRRIWKTILLAWCFASIVGISEELLQKMLPYRVFDMEDIVYNITGATIGVALYLIRPYIKQETR